MAYQCLIQAVRLTVQQIGKQAGRTTIPRTTIMRTSGPIYSICLATFLRMAFSRGFA